MKTVLILVIVAAGVFFFYPQFSEDTSGPCDALERISLRLFAGKDNGRTGGKDANAAQLFGQVLQGMSQGTIARTAVKDQYPNLPVTGACALLYWKAVIDPEGFRRNPLPTR